MQSWEMLVVCTVAPSNYDAGPIAVNVVNRRPSKSQDAPDGKIIMVHSHTSGVNDDLSTHTITVAAEDKREHDSESENLEECSSQTKLSKRVRKVEAWTGNGDKEVEFAEILTNGKWTEDSDPKTRPASMSPRNMRRSKAHGGRPNSRPHLTIRREMKRDRMMKHTCVEESRSGGELEAYIYAISQSAARGQRAGQLAPDFFPP
ncbi:hypothetical protein EI94DRAFT_1699455 [Lactarius quietus]|nr:hypothetical protein EI94DRAFT_1699455 [Lactarius quietus]